MWVRVATFEGADREKIDKLMAEQMSSGEMVPPDGMTSALILDEEGARKRKFFAFFDSREAVEAAEVVIYDGDVDAAKAARVSLLEGPSEAIDAGMDKTRSDTLPKVRAINGNVGAIGLADRDNGRVSIITLWDSRDSMRASAREADQLRQRSAEMSDQQIANVALYDVSMAQTVEGVRG